MAVKSVFLPAVSPEGNRIRVTGEEHHHLSVGRVELGERVDVFSRHHRIHPFRKRVVLLAGILSLLAAWPAHAQYTHRRDSVHRNPYAFRYRQLYAPAALMAYGIAGMENGIKSVMTNAPDATVVDDTSA